MATNPIRPWLARLQRRFSPRKIRLGSTNNTLLDPGGSETTLFIVGRELCLFTTLNAAKVPNKQRADFAAINVRRAAPFHDPDFDIAWFADGSAAVWYWSRSKIAALAASESHKRARFAAEPLYLGAPTEHAVELFAFAAGIEARVWHNHRLSNSRFWPEMPTENQWRDFMRGAGLPMTALPTTLDAPVPLASAPWNKQTLGAETLQLAGLGQYLPKIALVFSALVLLIAGFELGAAGRAAIDRWKATSAATQLDAPLQKILDARQATDLASAEIERLLSLHSPYSTTTLMAEITRLMPKTQWQLKRWVQPTPQTLEVSIAASSINPEQLVSTWEASSMLKNVTTELGSNNELVIKATLEPPVTSAHPEQGAP